MIDDILRESWVYKEWQQETEEKVLKKSIVAIIQDQFPLLLELTQKQLAPLKTPEQLQRCLLQLARAKDEEEARRILLTKVTE